MTSLEAKLRYNRSIKSYLAELRLLNNKDVSKEDLSSIVELEEIRRKSSLLKSLPISKFTIDFDERKSVRFNQYIQNLNKVNDSHIYIWTAKTNDCGLYKNGSIVDIDFSFPFEINEGVLVFLSIDLKDNLLLDFSNGTEGKRVLEVEAQGLNWPKISY